MPNVSALILAAGKGVRMKSSLPKVLHPVGGVSMVERVCLAASGLRLTASAVIVGHQGDAVREKLAIGFPATKFFTQRELNGSGGAARQALAWLKRQRGIVLLMCGDTPLLQTETLKELVAVHRREKNAATVLTTLLENPAGYGRIVRRPDRSVERIVEELDATPAERAIREINTGTYCFDAAALAWALPRLKNNNAKKEFYLTDTLELLKRQGRRVGAVVCADADEAMGVNQRADLAKAEVLLRRRTLERLMKEGVSILDPASTYVDDGVKVGPDTVLAPGTFLLGKTSIGSGCMIGPWAHVKDTQIGNNVVLRATFAESSIVDDGAQVGPFSRIRPNSRVGKGVHLGNFSEVKNSSLGSGTKVNHLSYVGDAKVGKNVNIGAGSITCNYDGIRKHPTTIHDHAFIGSNVNLIAPIIVGSHSVIGAGSSLGEDVPAWALAVERNDTRIKRNWAKHRRK